MARLIKGTFDNRSSKMLLNLQKFSRQNTKSILFVHYFKNFEFLPFFTELANAAAAHDRGFGSSGFLFFRNSFCLDFTDGTSLHS